MAPFRPFLPQFSGRHLLIIAVGLFFCYCCHADDGAPFQLSNYDCATNTKQVNGFNILDEGLMIGSSADLPPDGALPLFGYQKKEKLEVVIVVPTACQDDIQRANFMLGQNSCNKGDAQEVEPSKKCPASNGDAKEGGASPSCKAFKIDCDISTVQVKEDTSGRLFKIDLQDIRRITASSSCTAWSIYVEGVRLVLESKGSSDGEACASRGLAVWVIILIVAGGLFVLLAVIGGVGAVLLSRRRQTAQPATPAGAEPKQDTPWIPQQQSKMDKTGKSALDASAIKGGVASMAKTNAGMKESYAAMSRTAGYKLDMPKTGASKMAGASTAGVRKK